MTTSLSETAIFAAGCFWGVEDIFLATPGVTETEVGYTGGRTENPTYEKVCNGDTGHAEAVKVMFDPSRIKYEELLKIFWDNHNPTTRNRQGPDIGSQYRSVIFYMNDAQKKAAEKSRADLEKSGQWNTPIVTEIVPAETFYKAEEYHQKYHLKNGGSCAV